MKLSDIIDTLNHLYKTCGDLTVTVDHKPVEAIWISSYNGKQAIEITNKDEREYE